MSTPDFRLSGEMFAVDGDILGDVTQPGILAILQPVMILRANPRFDACIRATVHVPIRATPSHRLDIVRSCTVAAFTRTTQRTMHHLPAGTVTTFTIDEIGHDMRDFMGNGILNHFHVLRGEVFIDGDFPLSILRPASSTTLDEKRELRDSGAIERRELVTGDHDNTVELGFDLVTDGLVHGVYYTH